MSWQHASVYQGWICSDCACCHNEIEVANQTFYFIQSQYTDIRLTSPTTDPIMPGAWQGSHWITKFEVTGMTQPMPKAGVKPNSAALKADALTTRPTGWCLLPVGRLMVGMVFAEHNYPQARYHYVHSEDGEGCAAMLLEYHIARGYPSEVDLFITQAVLQ